MFERPSQLFDLNKRFRTKWRRPYIFQTINNVRSNIKHEISKAYGTRDGI